MEQWKISTKHKKRETLEIDLFKKHDNLSSIVVYSDKLNYQSINRSLYTKPESGNTEITLILYPMNTMSKKYKNIRRRRNKILKLQNMMILWNKWMINNK